MLASEGTRAGVEATSSCGVAWRESGRTGSAVRAPRSVSGPRADTCESASAANGSELRGKARGGGSESGSVSTIATP